MGLANVGLRRIRANAAAKVSGARRGGSVTACVLLTAGPAAGKTCLMSQLVMHTLEASDAQQSGLVPVSVEGHHKHGHGAPLAPTNEVVSRP